MIAFRAFALIAAAGLCLAIAGCGGSEEPESSAAPSSASSSVAAAAPAKPAEPADPNADRSGALLPVYSGGKWGMMDTQGRIAISPAYDIVDIFNGDATRAMQNGQWGLLNRQGEWIVKPQFTQLVSHDNGLFGYMKDLTPTEQEAGFITGAGQTIWKTTKGHAGAFSEDLAPVWATGADGSVQGVGFIRPDGSEAFKLPGATYAGNFANGLAPATKDGKQGFVDKTGQWVIEPKYDWVWPFSDGFALVAVIGEKSRPATDREKEQAAQSSGARRDVWLKGVYGFVTADGKEIVAPQYDSAWPYRENLAWVEKGGKIGYIDFEGLPTIDMQFEKAGFFVNGIAPVMKDGKWALLGTDMLIKIDGIDALLETEGDVLMGQFVEGMLPVQIGGKWGAINEEFKQVIAPQFAAVRHFSGELAAARELKDGKPGPWGFINMQGEWAVAPQFDKADSFDQGLARVYKGNSMGYINPKGEFVRALTN